MPRTVGRERVTCIAASSPKRIALIIPVEAYAKRARLTSPAALNGVAIDVRASSTSLRPPTVTGRCSTIAFTTSSRRASFCRTSPKIETRKIASGTIEKSTR